MPIESVKTRVQSAKPAAQDDDATAADAAYESDVEFNDQPNDVDEPTDDDASAEPATDMVGPGHAAAPAVECPNYTTCDDKTSTTHFLVPFCILI